MKESKKIQQLRTLFKYVSDSDKVIDGIFQDHQIRFTQPAALNDPLEFNPSIRFDFNDDKFNYYEHNGVDFPSLHDWYQLNVIEKLINRYGILSLCDNPFSFEMWSHYSNGHRGILLEFDIPDKSKPTLQITDEIKLRSHKVKYVKDYLINIDKITSGKDYVPLHKIRDAIYLRKTSHWKYEREYRIVRRLDECPNYKPRTKRTSFRDKNIYLFPLSLKCISAVIFGVNTSQKIKKKIIDVCTGANIPCLQTVIYKDQQNRIEFIPIETFGTVGKYLELVPQVFVTDYIKVERGPTLHMSDIKKLPYYHLQPDDWDDYYKKRLSKV